MDELDAFLAKVRLERRLQDEQWGGIGHDDRHPRGDWILYMVKQLGYASREIEKAEAVQFEHRMIKIAAIAVAAAQSSWRRRGGNHA